MSFKTIDKEYCRKDNETNLYMVMVCMEYFNYNNFINEFLAVVRKLELELSSISVEDILNIMGFPKNIFN